MLAKEQHGRYNQNREITFTDKCDTIKNKEKKMAGYQIKVNIEGVKPPMWRRLTIPDQITFAELHKMLQTAFGWEDCHLHDFVFQYFDGTVGDMDTTDAEYEEHDLLADDFLKDGWIRYTYDFGDNWCHKIVLEKELPDYAFRYPQVVKYKRNNFEEDSGGIWSDEEQGEYDMDEVNTRLAETCLCMAPDTYKTMKDLEADYENYENFLARMNEYSNVLDEIREWMHVDGEQENYSEMDERMEALENFYQQANIIKLGSGRKAGAKKCQVKHSKRIMEQLLYSVDEAELENYLRYLGQPVPKNHTVVNMARQISNVIRQHPEYLCMLLEAEEIRAYVSCYHGKGSMELPDKGFAAVCALWGLWEIEIEKERLTLSFPMDIAPIVEWMEQETWLDQCIQMRSTWNHIKNLLACYGFADLDELYDAYVSAFGEMDPAEFRRYVYLMGSFSGRIKTGVIPNEITWAALDDSIAVAAIVGQSEYASDLQYAKFSKTQVLNMQSGFGKLYPQWDKVLELLLRMGLHEQDAMELMNQTYEAVMYGAGMETLMAVVCEMLPEDIEGGELLRLRRALENCWCEMGIPMLKGHSRREIAKERGISALEVAVADEDPDFL